MKESEFIMKKKLLIIPILLSISTLPIMVVSCAKNNTNEEVPPKPSIPLIPLEPSKPIYKKDTITLNTNLRLPMEVWSSNVNDYFKLENSEYKLEDIISMNGYGTFDNNTVSNEYNKVIFRVKNEEIFNVLIKDIINIFDNKDMLTKAIEEFNYSDNKYFVYNNSLNDGSKFENTNPNPNNPNWKNYTIGIAYKNVKERYYDI